MAILPTMIITSNEGELNSASAVLEVSTTNPEYNQPALRIRQVGNRGARPQSESMIQIRI